MATDPPIDPARLSKTQDASALEGLGTIAPEDRTRFTDAVAAEGVAGWSYYFPYLQAFSAASGNERLFFETENGSIAVYRYRVRRRGADLSLLLPPFPFSEPLLRRGLDRSAAFNADSLGRVSRISEDCLAPVARTGLEIRFNADEYVYDRAAVAKAKGSAFASLRRKLGRYDSPDIRVRPYDPSDATECLSLLERWRAGLRERGVRIGPYRHYTRICLANANAYGSLLRGEIIELDERIVAFAFGGPITQETGSVFITVSDHAEPGIAYLQRAHLLKGFPELAYFNDNADSGRPGIAQMKRTFRPVRMHTLYSAKTRPRVAPRP